LKPSSAAYFVIEAANEHRSQSVDQCSAVVHLFIDVSTHGPH
jgi:hypothetical protein